jgi:hypothetical protein
LGPPRFTVTLKAEEGVLALEGHLPGGRALGALCAEKPFLTSAIMELRVPQVRRLPVCISRVDTTHKCLSLFEALGRPRPLIFAHAICATHAHSPSARSIGFCVIWVCISSSCACLGQACLFLERRRPSSLDPTAIGRVLVRIEAALLTSHSKSYLESTSSSSRSSFVLFGLSNDDKSAGR